MDSVFTPVEGQSVYIINGEKYTYIDEHSNNRAMRDYIGIVDIVAIIYNSIKVRTGPRYLHNYKESRYYDLKLKPIEPEPHAFSHPRTFECSNYSIVPEVIYSSPSFSILAPNYGDHYWISLTECIQCGHSIIADGEDMECIYMFPVIIDLMYSPPRLSDHLILFSQETGKSTELIKCESIFNAKNITLDSCPGCGIQNVPDEDEYFGHKARANPNCKLYNHGDIYFTVCQGTAHIIYAKNKAPALQTKSARVVEAN